MECKELIQTENMDKEEWLQNRRRGIGGSDIGAICGMNKYRTTLDVYLDKIGKGKEYEESEAAYFGTIFEDMVAKEFSHRTGYKVKKKNAILVHKDYPYMLANVDRLIVGKVNGEKCGLECKTASEYTKKYWEGEEVPLSYMLQCQWYMLITGYKKWFIAVLIGGNKFLYKEIDRDEELIQNIKDIAIDFWENNVLKLNPPVLDGSNSANDLLKEQYPEATKTTIKLDNSVLDKIERIEQLSEQIKELEEEKKTHENQIKDMLKDNETGIVGDRKVVWKNSSRTTFNTKDFKLKYPELYSEFSKTSISRRFSIK